MWPAFVALTTAEAVVGHALPWNGDSKPFADALLTALFLNLLVVAALAKLGGFLLRRFRRDLPAIVARDYAGTTMLLAIAVWLTAAGIDNHSTIMGHRRLLADAIVRAQAYIGDNAAAEFRRNVIHVSTYTIETGIYRVCVPGDLSGRTYCVVVTTAKPLASSVRADGYESNAVFSQGAR